MKLELSKESGYVHRRANKINNNTMPMEYEFSLELHKKLKEKLKERYFRKSRMIRYRFVLIWTICGLRCGIRTSLNELCWEV